MFIKIWCQNTNINWQRYEHADYEIWIDERIFKTYGSGVVWSAYSQIVNKTQFMATLQATIKM